MSYYGKLWYQLINDSEIWSFFRNVKYGLENFFHFSKVIWNFRPWDYSCNLSILEKSFERTADCIEEFGITEDKDKTVSDIRRFIWLLQNFERPLDLAEDELGEIDWNIDLNVEYPQRTAVFQRANELEEELWNEMWDLTKNNMRNWWD